MLTLISNISQCGIIILLFYRVSHFEQLTWMDYVLIVCQVLLAISYIGSFILNKMVESLKRDELRIAAGGKLTKQNGSSWI